jgi:hypothetical protein
VTVDCIEFLFYDLKIHLNTSIINYSLNVFDDSIILLLSLLWTLLKILNILKVTMFQMMYLFSL